MEMDGSECAGGILRVDEAQKPQGGGGGRGFNRGDGRRGRGRGRRIS